MNSYFANKTVVITGASTGIGAEIVRHLASLPVNLVLCARSKETMQHLCENLNIPTERFLIISIDFSLPNDFTSIVQSILQKL